VRLRELIGSGTLFSGIEMIFPALSAHPGAAGRLSRLPDRHPAARRLLRARLLIAWRNWLEARAAAPRRISASHAAEPAPASESA
jgi:electron transport complex protein RnfE